MFTTKNELQVKNVYLGKKMFIPTFPREILIGNHPLKLPAKLSLVLMDAKDLPEVSSLIGSVNYRDLFLVGMKWGRYVQVMMKIREKAFGK